VKTHYELLGLEPSADADAIKKAFRREIARYHPDKVIHLGAEFQEMAATRAAELTVAYKTLTDPALREEYDDSIATGAPIPHMPSPPRPAAREPYQPPPPPRAEAEPDRDADRKTPPPPSGNKARFAAERADRDMILKRAIAGRVLAIVEALHGKSDTPTLRGFDFAIVPQAKPRFLGSPPPRVLIKVIETADAQAITDAFATASRSRVHSGKSPVVVLLFSRQFAKQQEIARAHEANARQRKTPDAPDEIAVVLVDISDWSCHLPPNASAAVHKLTDQICA
jgi:curved DNA-binding protein CbpA